MNTTVNQTFDWSRFTAALRKEVVENKRAILFTLLGTYGLLTMIMILGNVSFGGADVINDVLDNYVPHKVVYGIFSFAIIIVASLAFRKLTTKTGRAEMFTSPSSMTEKFLVNILVYVIGYIVAFFISAQLADLTRFAVLWFFQDEHFIVPGPISFLNLIPDTVTGIGSIDEVARWMKPSLFIGIIFSTGLYLLGSVLWPRLSLLKTFAATYAVEFVIGIIAIIIGISLGKESLESIAYWLMDHMDQFMMTIMILYSLLAIVMWCVAWFLFKRKDVISLKWWK